MDEKLIAAIVAVLLALAGWLKNHSEVNGVKADRERTKMERDSRIARLEEKNKYLEARLSEGNDRFEKMENKLDETNKNVEQTNKILGEIKGALMNCGLVFSGSTPVIRRSGHTPEERPL